MEINNLNPKDPLQREIGVWLFRLSVADADKTNNLARHKRGLAGKLQAAIKRATGNVERPQAEQPRKAESSPITLEEAKARVELLKMSL